MYDKQGKVRLGEMSHDLTKEELALYRDKLNGLDVPDPSTDTIAKQPLYFTQGEIVLVRRTDGSSVYMQVWLTKGVQVTLRPTHHKRGAGQLPPPIKR